jgi:hypothetical protein
MFVPNAIPGLDASRQLFKKKSVGGEFSQTHGFLRKIISPGIYPWEKKAQLYTGKKEYAFP